MKPMIPMHYPQRVFDTYYDVTTDIDPVVAVEFTKLSIQDMFTFEHVAIPFGERFRATLGDGRRIVVLSARFGNILFIQENINNLLKATVHVSPTAWQFLQDEEEFAPEANPFDRILTIFGHPETGQNNVGTLVELAFVETQDS